MASASADVTKGIEPLTVHFSSAGSRDPDGDPLSYQWTFGDGTTSTEANPTKTYTDEGRLHGAPDGVGGRGAGPAQPIVIQVGVPPELTVSTPTEGQLYRAGDTITYNAFARDAAGFDLNDGDIKTEVRLHHGTHFHPFVGPLTGRAGSFTIPTTGEASADTSYEIKVTATDSNGLSTSKVVNIFPRKSQVSLATSPAGLGLRGRRRAGQHAAHVHRRRGLPARAVRAEHGGRPGRHAAPVRRLVGRQEHPPRHHDAGGRHHLHGDLRAVAAVHRPSTTTTRRSPAPRS